jgi:puromycin-sensitive aminopeptidase
VVPRHYTLSLEPDLAEFTFVGDVDIDLEIGEQCSSITLNAADIDFGPASLRTAAGEEIGVSEVALDESMQRATLHLDRPVPPGAATLSIRFTGILNDQLHGFYRSFYTDVDGERQVIATTQFEATDARRAFPCFDEPAFKATYGITLVVSDHLLALSNGAEVARIPAGDGKVAVRFADTMKMSTYLVALVVGPLVATEPVDVDGVPLRVITPRGKEHLAGFALEAGAFCLRYLTDYYGIPYPGDKVDLVAIPDFAFGAMENLGCITFRETALLLDTTTATQAELVRIVDVVAHELAHMWFGDLVTMDWWDGIWLNEAFASFMEMKATDAMHPEWKRWVSFGAVDRPWAFAVDALASTRPVEFEVGSPEEANEMFDALTYGKGSSVLRMIEQYLGEDGFRRGVGDYLRQHAYANTVTSDLWEGLDRASGNDVGAIMDTWILQGGFPQLEVHIRGSSASITQRRYLSIPDETDQTVWKVPIQLRGVAGGVPFDRKILLDSTHLDVEVPADTGWVVANAGGHGFYRVSYSPEVAKQLVGSLDQLDDLERFVLIDDAWALVENGQATVASFLDLATAYRDETEHSIWAAVAGGLGAVRHHVVADADLPAFHRVVTDLVLPAAERMGWEAAPDESDLDRRLRGLLLGVLGRLADHPPTVQTASGIADRWLESPTGLDPEVAQSSLFTWAANGGPERLGRLVEAYGRASTPQHELKLLQAMTFVDHDEAADRVLDAILDGTVRSQDAAWVAARLLGGRRSGPHVWSSLRARWSELTSKMPPATLRRMIEGIPALSQPPVAADVEAYFAETDLPAVAKTVAQNLEKLKRNRLLRARETEPVAAYLRNR